MAFEKAAEPEVSHPLDRPVWGALTGPQAHLAEQVGEVLRFPAPIGIFAAAREYSPAVLETLSAMVPAGGALGLPETGPLPPVPGLEAEPLNVLQMVAGSVADAPLAPFEIEQLDEADAAQMLALATLTEPGPFFERTHTLGDFFGVKQNGRLLAMAGERMKPAGFTEISAVCTHPDARGRGYAAALTRHVAQRVVARGETAFLHVFPHNTAAISVYEALGFAVRRPMVFTALRR